MTTFMCAILLAHMCWRSNICLIAAKPLPSILAAVREFSVRQVVDTVRTVTGRDVLVRDAPRRPGDPSVLVADATKAREVLGWAPERCDFATIVADAWRWHGKRFGSRAGA